MENSSPLSQGPPKVSSLPAFFLLACARLTSIILLLSPQLRVRVRLSAPPKPYNLTAYLSLSRPPSHWSNLH